MSGTLIVNDNSHKHDNHISNGNIESLPGNKPSEKNVNNTDTKKILLYKNGDKYFPPKRFVINKKHIRTWDSFLEQLTQTIQPKNGAIRDIRTPFHGTRIKSLDDLMIDGKYVVVPKGESLKLIDYANVIDVTNPLYQTKQNKRRPKPLRPTNHDMDKIESRITQQLYSKGIVIYVYRNGDPFTRGIKIVLNQFEKKHMSTLVRAIEERIILPSNRPIRRLYTMDGEIVKYAKNIEDGQYYIAASNEQFYNIKYGQYLPVIRGGKIHSSNRRIKYLNQSPTPVKDRPHELNPNDTGTRRSQKVDHSSERKQQPPTKINQKIRADKDTAMKALAASRIQAAFRGYAMRVYIEKAQKKQEPISRVRYINDKVKTNKHIVERPLDIQERKGKYYKDKKKKEDQTQDEKTNKSFKNKQLAASKIQAGFRGYRFRKIISKQGKKYIHEVPDIKRKANIQTKENKLDDQLVKNDEKEKRHQSAIRIQAAFRAFRTRQALKLKEQNVRKENAAIIIQSGYKGYKTRLAKSVKETIQKRDFTAVIIQYAYRAHKTRVKFKLNAETRRRELASIKIQAAYRGFKTRERFNNIERKECAATVIQYAYRAHKARETFNLKTENRRNAIVKIQAAYRGYTTRVRFKMKERKENAAIKIQAAYRGYTSRERFKMKEQKENAAIKIQAAYRGYTTRERFKMKEQKENAAVKIQAGYRGFNTRERVKEKIINETKEKSAKKIQASFRGFQVRNTIINDLNARLHEKTAEEQAIERHNAAVKIQASFRGFTARKDVTS